MKRAMFLLVSLIIAGSTYVSNWGKDITSLISNSNEISVKEQNQNQALILEQAANMQMDANWHYSHSSHWSHGSHISHGSHGSHYSHYSSKF